MAKPVSVEIRLDNIIYECFLEKKIYNYEQSSPYAITLIQGVVPNENGFQPVLVVVPVCGNCWKKGVEAKEFEEPSPIKIPSMDQVSKIKRKGGLN